MNCISIFKRVEKFLDQASQNPPDVVGLSVYFWNLSINDLRKSGKITEHDVVVAKELANVISGGKTDILEPMTERQLLDLECEAISKLFRESKTLDRMEHMLTKGKPLRN